MSVQVIRPLSLLPLVLVDLLGVDTQLVVEVKYPLCIINNNNMAGLLLAFLYFMVAQSHLSFFYDHSLESF